MNTSLVPAVLDGAQIPQLLHFGSGFFRHFAYQRLLQGLIPFDPSAW